MTSTIIDWENMKKRLTDFGAGIYPFEECSLGGFIGEGAAMEVYRGECKINMTRERVAFKYHKGFKRLDRLKQKNIDSILEEFRHEIKLMKRLISHMNVVRIYGIAFDKDKPVLIVELGDETLDKYLQEKFESGNPASWIEKFQLCHDVLKGIRGLHDAGIIHGDIKGENILVFIGPTGTTVAKISDFGYSSTLTSSKGHVGGTLAFRAPEVMGIYPELIPWRRKQIQDIFSFGLVTYQIAANGKRPYEDSEDIFDARTTDRDMEILFADLPSDTPEQFRTIIVSTTKFMPTDRASIDIVDKIIMDFLSSSESQEIMMEKLQNMTITDSLHAEVYRLQNVIFQFHEDTLPRFFVILPEDGVWDFKADILLSRSYRLYFLCEHRRTLQNGKEMNEIHLVKHNGYKLRQPRQFVEKYGSYIVQIMPYIKLAIHIAQTSPDLVPFVDSRTTKLMETGVKIYDMMFSATDSPILKNKEYAHQKKLKRPDMSTLQEYLHDLDGNNSLNCLQRVLFKNDILWVCETHATTCYSNANSNEIQRIISGTSINNRVFFDSKTYELRINRLDEISFASLFLQLKPYLQQVPLLKISFEDIKELNISNLEAILDASPTVRVVWFIKCTFQTNMLKSPTLYYLQELIIHDIIIGPSEAQALADLLKSAKFLVKLYLKSNAIGEVVITLADSLKQSATLTELNLKENNIGEKGGMALADSLKQNSTLTKLHLLRNGIGDKGAIALADSLKQNSVLTHLSLESNDIGEKGGVALADSLKQNSALTQLYLPYNSIGEKGGIALADSLKQNSVLTELILFANDIGEKGGVALADSLKQNSTLTKLNLFSNDIGEKAGVALAGSLKQNSALTHLDLSWNNIRDNGAIALADSLKQNSALTRLDLYGNNILDNGAIALADSLKQNSALTQLDLQDNNIGEEGGVALADSLKQNTFITQLNLKDNKIGNNGAIALANSLKQNSSLINLNLWDNKIGDDGAIALANSLKQNTVLTELNFRDNNISYTGKHALRIIKRQNPNLNLEL